MPSPQDYVNQAAMLGQQGGQYSPPSPAYGQAQSNINDLMAQYQKNMIQPLERPINESPYYNSLMNQAQSQAYQHSAGSGLYGGARSAQAAQYQTQLMGMLEMQRRQQLQNAYAGMNPYLQSQMGLLQGMGGREDQYRQGSEIEMRLKAEQEKRQQQQDWNNWMGLLQMLGAIGGEAYKGYSTFGGGGRSGGSPTISGNGYSGIGDNMRLGGY